MQRAKKRYIYSDHLQFLLKIAQKDETETNFSQAETEGDSTEVDELTESQLLTASSRYAPKSTSQTQPALSTSRSTSSEHRPKSKRRLDDIDREILSELQRGNQSVESGSENAFHSHHPRSGQEILLLSSLPYNTRYV